MMFSPNQSEPCVQCRTSEILVRQCQRPIPLADDQIGDRPGPGRPHDIDEELPGRVRHEFHHDRARFVPPAERRLKDGMTEPIPTRPPGSSVVHSVPSSEDAGATALGRIGPAAACLGIIDAPIL